MKIFGLELFSKKPAQKPIVVQDEIPDIKATIPDTIKPAIIKPVKDPTLLYRTVRSSGRGAFSPSEYDLAEVGRVEDTDSYCRQAFGKKVALMFKEGWEITGKNLQTIKYTRARFAQIARASKLPTALLLRQIGSSLVRKSNAFVIKVRKTESSGGKIRQEPGKAASLKPVAGYFVAPAEAMHFELTGDKVTKWRQKMPNGDYKDFNPRDVIHFYHDRKDGFVFGTPLLVPVVDDIRALRKIEENIEMLVYQHLFPLFHYKVGTPEAPAGVTEAGDREVDVVKREIQYMPSEGGIVTPERHEIKTIGAEGRALRADGYLEYFKRRVFAGLGVSAVDMGDGNTTNRACYSEDTETLTDSGFKKYWEITPEDKIGTFNPETGSIEFHKPNGDILLYDYQGKMFHFQNRNVDVLVTPDHDMWMGRPRNSSKLTWEKIHAEDINIHQFKFLSGGLEWKGIEPEDFQLPYCPYKCYSSVPNSGPWGRIDIGDWLQFLGFYLSEGTLAKSPGQWAVSISQNQRVNPDKTDFIREVLNRLPFKFNEYVDVDDTVRFWINCKSLYLYLEDQCGDYSYKKHIPPEILNYDSPHLRILLEALMIGDGTEDKRDGRTSRTYYSTSHQLIDQVQEIALKLGYRAHVLEGSGCWRVCMSEGTISNVTQDYVTPINYDGKVYCFNVPNHLFITRRNGRIGIHGNTADNMSRNLIDSVKDLQQVLEAFVNHEMISELLLESTFGVSVLDEENTCTLKFKEIDVDAQIKRETHAADQFAKDAIHHDELRRKIGLEPLEIPTREEIDAEQDTAENYPEWHRTRWKLFAEPQLLIQALDEPWSPTAKAAARSSALETTQSDIDESANMKQEQEAALEREKAKAKAANKLNVGTTRPSRPKRKDGYLQTTYMQVTKDIVEKVSLEQQIDHDWVAQLVRTQLSTTVDRLIVDQMMAFRNGYSTVLPAADIRFMTEAASVRSKFVERAERYITRLTNHVVRALHRKVDNNTTPQEITLATRAVFDSFRYRTQFIEDVEVRKAATLGKVIAWKRVGIEEVYTIAGNPAVQCDTCKSHNTANGGVVTLGSTTLDNIPPYHANCNCTLVQFKTTATTEDAVQDDTGSIPPPKGVKMSDEPADKPLPGQKNVASCPKCGKTAIQKKDTPDIYNCRACKYSFRLVTGSVETEDALGPKSKRTQFLKCVQKAKSRLKAAHPNWDAGRIEMMAETACDHLLQDQEEGDIELTDGEKMDHCVSKVKAQLRQKNPSWSEDKITSSAFAICTTSLKGK